MNETRPKVTGLTALNVKALDEVAAHLCETTATTATFWGPAEANKVELVRIIDSLPGRGHPKASLWAVARKLQTIADMQERAADR